MSDAPLPGDDNRESVPLLLARVSRLPRANEPTRTARRATTRQAAPPLAGVEWGNPGAISRLLGRAGLLVAALLVLLSVFADLLASDLPLFCRVGGSFYVLPNVTRPRGDLETMDRGTLAREASWVIPALVRHGPRVSPGEEIRPLLAPSSAHPLGTDREGRDVFARTVHGTRSYLVFALAATFASVGLGALLGAIAGLFGGAIDTVVSRVIESVSAFPPLVLVLGIQAAVPRPTLFTLFLAIALIRWPEIARLVRGEVLSATTRDYVVAARALGASPLRILSRHIAPNVGGPLVVAAAVGVGAVVLTEAALDFLRVGTPAGAASWGETMSQFRDAPSAWWLLAFPGVLLVVTIVAYNMMGEALRGMLDPRSP
jgi:ABC-type dipeptide/oligopeptide/nickel transport system permease subunit